MTDRLPSVPPAVTDRCVRRLAEIYRATRGAVTADDPGWAAAWTEVRAALFPHAAGPELDALLDRVNVAAREVAARDGSRGAANLFRAGVFTLASGATSDFKIECDALTPADWAGLAVMALPHLPPFGQAVGVPRGGLPFAAALARHITPRCHRVLVCEDVVTTGESLKGYVKTLRDDPQALWMGKYTQVVGVCVFARGPCPAWVTPLFRLPGV